MARKKGDDAERLRATQGISGFIATERARLYDGASPERRERLAAAERRGAVFAAWNAVTAGTREGAHVTGLHYVPESNELVVYVDTPAWTQELSMLREIVRARMRARGADVAAIVFKTSRGGYLSNGQRAAGRDARAGWGKRPPKPPVPHEDLTAEEDSALAAAVAPIEDPALREALHKAMKASFEWKKGRESSQGR